jgi:hypothetical protein
MIFTTLSLLKCAYRCRSIVIVGELMFTIALVGRVCVCVGGHAKVLDRRRDWRGARGRRRGLVRGLSARSLRPISGQLCRACRQACARCCVRHDTRRQSRRRARLVSRQCRLRTRAASHRQSGRRLSIIGTSRLIVRRSNCGAIFVLYIVVSSCFVAMFSIDWKLASLNVCVWLWLLRLSCHEHRSLPTTLPMPTMMKRSRAMMMMTTTTTTTRQTTTLSNAPKQRSAQ